MYYDGVVGKTALTLDVSAIVFSVAGEIHNTGSILAVSIIFFAEGLASHVMCHCKMAEATLPR